MSRQDTEEAVLSDDFHPLYNPFRAKPLLAKEYDSYVKPTYPTALNLIPRNNFYDRNILTIWPIFGPLLFENSASDVRDHAANERSLQSCFKIILWVLIYCFSVLVHSPPVYLHGNSFCRNCVFLSSQT